MWKKKCQLRKIDQGQILGMSVGLMLCIYLAIFMMAQTMWQRMSISSTYLEDALACSNMAGALINLKEYGFSGDLVLISPEEVREQFMTALRVNLNLDESYVSRNHNLISGKVDIDSLILYNVTSTRVFIYTWGETGFSGTEGVVGQVYAPNGQSVEKTGIYSEISYDVLGIFGEVYRAHKSKLVDVVAERR